TATDEMRRQFDTMRERYTNKAVTESVKNTTATERIVEFDNRLMQKLYPIYQNELHPRGWWDFSANFYQPVKYFAGLTFDTFIFNIAVIWSMTIFLFLTLYLDALKRFVKLLSGNRRYRKMA
ncbi:MAG: ABC transporter ATP-binding protein, partial [Bacteroidia bacterium]|nr:ABC transporter ATP-binding protein [Bacteroidia bacterium]